MYVYADVFWDLKLFVFEALARAYKLQFFLSVHKPPKYQKAGYTTAHPYRNYFFIIIIFACQLVPPENEDPLLVRIFFLAGGGGAWACQFTFLVPPYENPRPPPPPVPPYWKILATPLLGPSGAPFPCHVTSSPIQDGGAAFEECTSLGVCSFPINIGGTPIIRCLVASTRPPSQRTRASSNSRGWITTMTTGKVNAYVHAWRTGFYALISIT